MNFLYLMNVILIPNLLRFAWDHDKNEMLIIAVAMFVINFAGYIMSEMRDDKR